MLSRGVTGYDAELRDSDNYQLSSVIHSLSTLHSVFHLCNYGQTNHDL